jgi:hypothetical protein
MTMAANDVQIQIIGKDLASPAFKAVDDAARRSAQNLEQFGRSVNSVNGFLKNSLGFAAAIAGFEALDAMIRETIGSAGEFYKTMETGSISMAGTLLSMTTINGETVKWGQALAMSKDIMLELSDTALRTGVSTHELTDTFRAMLPAALNAKMTVQQTMDLASRLLPVGKGMGLNETTLMRDVADLITGNNVQRTKMGSILGISEADIKQAKESAGGLYQFLSDRLQGEKEASDHYLNSLEGRINHLREAIVRISGVGVAPVFESINKMLTSIANKIVTVDEQTKEVKVNPEIVKTLHEISDVVIQFGGQVKNIVHDISIVAVPAIKLLGGGLKYAAENAEAVSAAIGAWAVMGKVSVLYKDYMAVINGATEAQTFLGKAVLDTKAKYAEQAAAATLAAETERAAAVQQEIQTAMTGKTMETAAVAAALGQKNLANAISQTVMANEEQSIAAAKTAEVMAAANTAIRNGQIGIAEAILAANLSLEDQAVIAEQVAARIVIAEQLERAGQIELAQAIVSADLALNGQGTAATVAGARTATAAKTAAAGQKILTASVATTTAANLESGAAAVVASEKTVSAMAVAGTATGGFLRALWTLAGGWVGVAVATGLAVKAVYDYFDTKNKVESYDPKAEVYNDPDRPGKHLKKVWAEDAIKDQRGNTLPGWKRVPLSDAEEEEFTAWKTWKEKNDADKPWRDQSADEMLKQLKNKFNMDEGKTSHKKHAILDEAGSLKQVLEDAANSAGVNPELFAALVKQESGFNTKAYSRAGAAGLTQLMPGTAAALGVNNRFDPQENAQGGAEYLAEQLRTFGGDTRLALAAYNAGPGTVSGLVQQYGANWGAVSQHLPQETKNYVASITAMLENSNQTNSLKVGNFYQRLQEYKQKAVAMYVSLNDEINKESSTTYQTGMENVSEKVGKMTAEATKLGASGVDITPITGKISEYQKVMSEKVTRTWRESWQGIKNDTAKTEAENADDPAAAANAEYAATILQLQKERRAKEKAVMQDRNDKEAQLAVDKWYNDQIDLAGKTRLQKLRDNDLKQYNDAIQHNNNLLALNQQTAAETDSLNVQVLNNEFGYLNQQLETAKLTAREREDIETNLAELTQKKNELLAKNLSTAYGVAIQAIKKQTYDYANTMVQTFDGINSDMEQGFQDMLTRTKSCGDGFVEIFENVAKRIESTLAEVWYQQTLAKPVTNWFTGMLNNFGGGGSSGHPGLPPVPVPLPGRAGGGYIAGEGTGTSDSILLRASNGEYMMRAAAVNHFGVPFFDELNAGRMPRLQAFATGGLIGAAGSAARGSGAAADQNAPDVQVVINNYGSSQVEVGQLQYDEAARKWVLLVTLDAAVRNEDGYGRNMKTALVGG